ncbi:hypothetical protein A4X13_0g3080 [Tilletia indica]|uniref:Uncharacterized protein n=1 Tax=Tilletia indica TaxID=43049 RepID=A0A177TPF8_9BASI|nr:hypothetical protein A4X13_0g3080 [Tilletia indica]
MKARPFNGIRIGQRISSRHLCPGIVASDVQLSSPDQVKTFIGQTSTHDLTAPGHSGPPSHTPSYPHPPKDATTRGGTTTFLQEHPQQVTSPCAQELASIGGKPFPAPMRGRSSSPTMPTNRTAPISL